jgi:carboxylesterase
MDQIKRVTGNPVLANSHLEGDPFEWPGGPVGVLLVHGLTATVAEVRPLAKILHAHGYAVAGPLLPGHGTTPEDANCYTWQDWLEVVERAYEKMIYNCEQVFVGGESTGAVLALELASNHPEIRGLLIYAPALVLQLSPARRLLLYTLAPFVTGISKGPVDAASEWQGYPVNPLKSVVQLIRLGKVVRKNLPHVHQPILIVQGRKDATVAPTAPQIIYDEVCSIDRELHWMEDSTHVVILDKERDKVGELTLAFMQRVLANPVQHKT